MAITTTTQTMTVSPQNTEDFVTKEMKLLQQPRKHSYLDDPITLANWYKHVNWLHAVLLTSTPLIAIYGFFTTPLLLKTFIWSFIWYFCTGIGITAGYHRLWAHRAYTASLSLKLFLLACASGAVEGSARWWCRDHRAHHRYTDTDRDPYNAHRGLLYSHVGWMYLKQNPQRIGRSDISDLNADPLLSFQHRYYGLFALTFGVLFPMAVTGLGWGDWRGGFFFAAIARLVVVHHATFCVNSLAHYLGDTTYDDKHTPRDHFITAILTMGEGYHNFHHEFPQDYRNAIRFYQYDPTKWLIKFCSWFGLSTHLKRFPDNEVAKGQLFMQQKKLDAKRRTLNWGVPLEKLPIFTFEEFQEISKTKNWVLIEGIIHDVTNFIDEHPGGKAFITSSIGRDMTTAFNGGVYDHSNAARNLTSMLRVGVIAGGGEVEHRKTK
ncbi:5448_t:CDS:2 [Ambispora leptoticha]|uniref:Acyl-CoA desaturase n=1 Tax=Ambispora leptoticha TaxID=144679 RepID=A0A9N8Z203_9GLOM|nr:5448_t:CDS:2 [Ambispora leptoticha]